MDLFSHAYSLPTDLSERLQIVARQIEFARGYTLSLLEGLTDDDWFWSPTGYVTHIAWQVGHLAMAQYGLALFRQRGRAEVDAELMSGRFRKLFLKGSEPQLDRGTYPPPREILDVMNRVHRQVLSELPRFDGAALDEPSEPPHSAYATKYGALLFTAQHEFLHAGQIGVIRRLMGQPPLR